MDDAFFSLQNFGHSIGFGRRLVRSSEIMAALAARA